MQRAQVAAQLQALLVASGALGSSTSAFLTTLSVETFLASGKALPIAAVKTLPAKPDRDGTGRVDEARFRVSFCASAPTETQISQYPGSGGDGTSQTTLETAIGAFLAYCQSLQTGLGPGLFTQTTHGFQGKIETETEQRLVVIPSGKYVVSELELVVYDCLQTTTGSISPPVPPPPISNTITVTADRALTSDDSKNVFVVPSSVTDDLEFALPPWAQDLQYSVVVESPFVVELDANGTDTIHMGPRSGPALQTVAKGVLTLRATVPGEWTVFYATGSGWQFAQEAGPT